MAVDIRDIAIGDGDHVVHFYEHDADLCEAVAGVLADGLHAGSVAVVIATETHMAGLRAELRAAGIDVARADREGRLVSLDAAATLDQFVLHDEIDAEAFQRVIGGVIRQAAATGRPIQAYGEMVAVLWEAGDVLLAIELEKLWNDLSRAHHFSLLCAYPASSVCGPDNANTLKRICRLHSSMTGVSVSAAPLGPIEVSEDFSAERTAPGEARRFFADVLQQHGYGGAMLDDAQLVLSELATNAVAHARSPFSVVARFQESGVRLSVRDSSPRVPTMRDAGPMASSGRGLQLVAALALDWGVEVTPDDGKTVWAELRA
jgi:anti-sigma regulatory factor (Ser/Thr protein kinase)